MDGTLVAAGSHNQFFESKCDFAKILPYLDTCVCTLEQVQKS
jgi:hypothetical protein